MLVAVCFGVSAAVAYGASTAVQHAAVHTGTGQADPRGLIRLLRDPRWLLSIGGDTVGFALQVVALANGPVVLVQPLLVLTLPVSLFFGSILARTRPRAADYAACLAIGAGLTAFFWLLGTPASGRTPSATAVEITIVVELAAGALLCALAHRRAAAVRAGVYGGVAGAWFGTIGVMLNCLAVERREHGAHGIFVHADGLAPLAGLLILGGLGMMLTQVSFQVGALAASFPANKAADPLVAVILGAVLLHERVPHDAAALVVDALCLLVIIVGAVRLSRSGQAAPAAVLPPPNVHAV
jgi:hypothetical protein